MWSEYHSSLPGQMMHGCQAEQERETSQASSRRSSTTTITQSGAIHPAVARYEVVPIKNGRLNVLTSYLRPGTIQDGEMLDQSMQRKKMIRPNCMPGQDGHILHRCQAEKGCQAEPYDDMNGKIQQKCQAEIIGEGNECPRGMERSGGDDVRKLERKEGGRCEKSWEQMRKSRDFIKEASEKWQDLAEVEKRGLEREGKKMRQEILKKRKEKFGKDGS